MTTELHGHLERGKARIVDAPAPLLQPKRNQVEGDRNFELPTALYGVTVGCYLGFIAMMFAAFSAPAMIIPVAIFGVFIVAGFGVPAIWTRLARNDSKAMSIGNFKQGGIITYTGRLAPRDAAIQMLILPVLIVFWACAVIAIAALV